MSNEEKAPTQEPTSTKGTMNSQRTTWLNNMVSTSD